MSNKLIVWLLAASTIWITSCHKQKISQTSNNQAKKDSLVVEAVKPETKTDSSTLKTEPTVAPKVTVSNAEFAFLTTKSKFSFKNQTQDLDNVTVNLRIQKDSLIWISVTGVGFEVARGLISRDSIAFMDKIHKTYFLFDYEQLSKKYNFKLDFPLLQSVIIGNLPFPQTDSDSVLKEKDYYVLKQNAGRISAENYISETTLKLLKLKASETPGDNTFSLDYQDFKPVNDLLFPFVSNMVLNVKSPKDQQFYKTEVGIKHNKVEVLTENPGFPFSIPSSYKRKM